MEGYHDQASRDGMLLLLRDRKWGPNERVRESEKLRTFYVLISPVIDLLASCARLPDDASATLHKELFAVVGQT